MTISKHFHQLQAEDRVTIASLLQQRQGVRQIARTLGRSAGTISRELKRNGQNPEGYASQIAQAQALRRRQAARPMRKLEAGSPLWDFVCKQLRQYWSPEQIAAELRRLAPDDRSKRVSHETIYTTIYAHAKGELRRELIALLRRAHSKRRSRSAGQDRRGQIQDMLSIHVRPPEIEDRVMPGHWEGDLIKGAGNQSSIGVLVERSSRLILLAKMDSATAQAAFEAFNRKLCGIAAPMRKTLTYDRGKEMALHARLSESTGMAVYFCDPHSPWQRGTCENTNGLLRQFFPKGTDLSIYSQEDLDHVSDLMNGRPRKVHDGLAPLVIYRAMLERASSPQQSIH